MNRGVFYTLVMVLALSAQAQTPEPMSPEQEAAVAAVRIRAAELTRRAQENGAKPLVVAGVPSMPLAQAAPPRNTPPVITPPPTRSTVTPVPALPAPSAPAGTLKVTPPASSVPASPQAPAVSQPVRTMAGSPETPGVAPATTAPPSLSGSSTINGSEPIEFDWMNADVSQVLAKYSELTHRSAIMPQNIQGVITFHSAGPLTIEEAKGALESVLLANGLAIVPMGEKFFKVVPSTSSAQEGVSLSKEGTPSQDFDRVVAQIVRVKYLDVNDVARALGGGSGGGGIPGQPPMPGGVGGGVFLHAFGKIVAMPRSSALLLMDTEMNVSRLKQILELMDKPGDSMMETRVYVLENADAATVSGIIQQLIAADQGSTSGAGQATPQIPGVPGGGGGRSRASVNSIDDSVILGRVLSSYDDRTNAIILITQKDNFPFFEKIIKALDVKTGQDFKTKVFFLKYAQADVMANTLYQLAQGAAPAFVGSRPGTTTGGQSTRSGTSSGTRSSTSSGFGSSSTSRSSSSTRSSATGGSSASRGALGSNSTNRSGTQNRQNTAGVGGVPGAAGTSSQTATQLIQIIPDMGNNALVIYAPETDIKALKEVIDQLDIFQPQVHIDVVVAEISLDGSAQFGMDLFQKVLGKNPKGAGVSSPDGSALPTSNNGTNSTSTIVDPKTLLSAGSLPTGLGAGATYFFSLFGGDLKGVVNALAVDSHFKVLQTPHVYTSNNQMVRIFAGESRPFVTSVQQTINSDQTRSNYENQDIGVELNVTPLINDDGVVTLNIFQGVNDVKGTQLIDGNQVPIVSRREAEAQAVTVKDGQIIIWGGLNSNNRKKTENRVPVLGDIPLLGNAFKKTVWTDNRTELVFFLRPKVIRTPEEAQRFAWGFVGHSKDLRAMPLRDVEGYTPLQDKRYSEKLKALDRFDKSDKF